jgi:uncharacterized integral membrane protein
VLLCALSCAPHLDVWGLKEQMTEREGPRNMTKAKKVKIVAILVVSLLSLIVFIQNRQAVDTKLLFVTTTMPLAVLLILTFIMGSILGLIIASHVLRGSRKPEKQ